MVSALPFKYSILFHRLVGMNQLLVKDAIESQYGRLNQLLLRFLYVLLHSLDLSVQGNQECQVQDNFLSASFIERKF
jgi:hypothetical protein